MSESLSGKVALVTGGGSGIGRATALAMAEEGAKVAVCDVNAEGGEGTVSAIAAAGGDATFIHADVSQARDVEAMVDRVMEVYGRLDCAFNNAGISGGGVPTHEHPEEVWDRVISINLKGVWLCMKYEIPRMLERGGGAIVNTASVAGLVGIRNGSAYDAAKHGVVGLTKTAALEYAQQGIRVNAVCPGYVRTPMVERVLARDPGNEAAFTEREPIGRLGVPEEIAATVAWLCSDAASFVTGVAMPVDGGYVAQ